MRAEDYKQSILNKELFLTIKFDPRIGRNNVEVIVNDDPVFENNCRHYYGNTELEALQQAHKGLSRC